MRVALSASFGSGETDGDPKLALRMTGRGAQSLP